MRVCIVGNGPSAKGKGKQIDACDFVVRMKAFWMHGADDAGEQTDAVAWFGYPGGWDEPGPPLRCEHWYTHCAAQVKVAGDIGYRRLEFFSRTAGLLPARWYTNDMWHIARGCLKCHPSTGFVTVQMALALFPECELVLYGYDSTLPDLPNYSDARCDHIDTSHQMLREKTLIGRIAEGYWLGGRTAATLSWPDKPDLAAAQRHLKELEAKTDD